MKMRGILSLLAITVFAFASMAQKGENKKKDWNPEKKVEAKVERFANENEISDEQKEALKKSLLEHHEEMKTVREAEKERKKEMWKENKAKKDEKVKSALNDENLTESWKEFEKVERAERKEKMKKRRHHKGKKKHDMKKKEEKSTR